MLFLIRYVFSHAFNHCFTDGYRKVLILPAKFAPTQLILVYPERRLALYQLHYLFNGLARAERNQAMYVVDIAADEIKINVLGRRIVADVLEYFLPDFIAQVWFSVFGRPDKVDPDFDKWHGDYSAEARRRSATLLVWLKPLSLLNFLSH